MTHDMDNEKTDRETIRVGWCSHSPRRSIGRAILGISVIALGVLWTLDNIDVVDAGPFWAYWPVVLIALGLSYILNPGVCRRIGAGLIWLTVGTVLLLDNLGYIAFNVWELWPLALVFGGGSILFHSMRTRKRTISEDNADELNATAVLGAVVRKITSDKFVGGQAMAFMGGCELDLRDAVITGGPAEIQTTALLGAVEIHVPREWQVQVKGTAILGGFEDKTSRIGDGDQVLIVSGVAFLGGVEIKN